MVPVFQFPFVYSNPVKSKYCLACCAIVLIVLLRVGIGWHFFYEGVHKFDPAAEFSSEGFLGIAKGPTAELYYWMLPDLEGLQRIVIANIMDENEKERKTFIVYEEAWKEYFKGYLEWYAANASRDDLEKIVGSYTSEGTWKNYCKEYLSKISPNASKEDAEAVINYYVSDDPIKFKDYLLKTPDISKEDAEAVAKMTPAEFDDYADKWAAKNVVKNVEVAEVKILFKSKMIFNRYLNALRLEATDSEKDVEVFLQSRDRFLENRKTYRNNTSFEQERRWNAMMKYRREAAVWTKLLTDMGNGLQSDLGRVAEAELAGLKGLIVTAPEKELIPPNDFVQFPIPSGVNIPLLDKRVQSRMEALDLAVMVGLSAIGLCLMLGFCTRLACLGGAAFLVNVVLTTFPIPGVYPPLPPAVGNFMGVSKDVVELLAMLFLALIPAGRWGGLDYFLWHYGGKQIVGLFCFSDGSEK